MRRVLLVTSLVAAAIAAIGTGTAGAFTITCAYSAPTQQVTITMAGANAFTNVSVGAGGAILDDGVPCDVATLTNTTSIVATADATGGHTFSIDLSGGPFIDPNTSAELHFTVDLGAGPADTFQVQGSSGPDFVVAGANGVNLDANASQTVDVTLTGAETFQAYGGDGNDVLSGNGGRGTGAPLSFRDVLRGDGGNDVLLGTPVTDSLRGGPGNDVINGFGGEDTAEYILAPTSVFVSLTGGFALGGDGSDLLANIEDISGSSHDDVLIGDGGPNSLSGLDGNDFLFGLGGDDNLFGGNGDDFINGGAGTDSCSQDVGTGTLVNCP
jgi:Ca2+-binding RTX toxin-like protein